MPRMIESCLCGNKIPWNESLCRDCNDLYWREWWHSEKRSQSQCTCMQQNEKDFSFNLGGTNCIVCSTGKWRKLLYANNEPDQALAVPL